jgi:hypothetical protein
LIKSGKRIIFLLLFRQVQGEGVWNQLLVSGQVGEVCRLFLHAGFIKSAGRKAGGGEAMECFSEAIQWSFLLSQNWKINGFQVKKRSK